MNYAERDQKHILEYIKAQGGECGVKELFNLDTIDTLRIYTLIYQMKDSEILAITGYSAWGAPVRVKLL